MSGSVSGLIAVKRGRDFDFTLFKGVSVDASLIFGGCNPSDLTGYTAQMQIRKTITSDVVQLEFNTTDGSIIITGEDGKLNLLKDSSATSTLEEFSGVYDLFITTPAPESKRQRVLSGNFTVSESVTR